MSDTLSVTITRKHNLGNYEHVEGSITLAMGIPEGAEPAEFVAMTQALIRPYLSQDALLRGATPTPKARVEVKATEGAAVDPLAAPTEQPAKRTRAKAEKPAVRGAGRAAEEARTIAEANDPLADPGVVAEHRAASDDPLAEEPQQAAVDPFGEDEPAAVVPAMTPAEMRKAVTLACASDPKVQAKVVEHLHASGLVKFKDVPDERLGEYYAIVKAGA